MPPETQPGSPEVGTTLAGKYVLLRKLGEGGMGAVFEAQHLLIGRRFAIKFLRPELAREVDILARFRREARAVGSLESEHVATVVDFGSIDGGLPYIVMEFLNGDDFRTVLKRDRQLPAPRAAELVIQACRGLALAHANGIVHRDLKPENLFITKRSGADLVKILDFGVAKLRSAPSSDLATKPGAIMGTLHYMPPEQIRGAESIDHRADIYALGAILYECLAGRLPHTGSEPHTVVYHIMHQPIPRLESLRPDLPEGLASVVHKALARTASDRHSSAEELGKALAPFARADMTPFEWPSLAPALASHQSEAASESADSKPKRAAGRAAMASTVAPAESAAEQALFEPAVGNAREEAVIEPAIVHQSVAAIATSVPHVPRSKWRRSARAIWVGASLVLLGGVLLARAYFAAPLPIGGAAAPGISAAVPEPRAVSTDRPPSPRVERTPVPASAPSLQKPAAASHNVTRTPAVPVKVRRPVRPTERQPATSKNGAPILE